MKQIYLDHNVGVVLCTGCTGVHQSPISALIGDRLCGPPGIPVEVFSMVKIAAIPEHKQGKLIRICMI